VQDEFMLDALGGVGEGSEHLQPLGQMRESFHIRGALARQLASPLPVLDGLGAEARLRIMLRQQFRLGGGGFGKSLFQHLRNTLVILLACALQQGLICGILDQRVLEEIRRLRWHAALVEQFGVYELC